MSMMDKFNEWRGKDRRRYETIVVAHDFSRDAREFLEKLLDHGSANNKLDQLFVQLTRMETEQGLLLDLVEKLGTDPAAIKEAAESIRALRQKLKTSVDKQTQEGV